MQKVIFFTSPEDVAGIDGVTLRSKSGAAFFATVGGFVAGTIPNLLVPKPLITGWMVGLRTYPEIVFIGDFTEEEQQQARGRIRRIPHKPVV